MQAVSDATPLIHLSKISKVSYLKKLFGAIFIPKEIFEEIVIKGKGHKEVAFIEKLIEETRKNQRFLGPRKSKGFSREFVIVKDARSSLNMPNLHIGELKAMALCKDLKVRALLIDEKEGYEAALILGLKPLRTTSLLLRMLNRKMINFNDYKEALIALSESGYFLSAETYERLLEAGRKGR